MHVTEAPLHVEAFSGDLDLATADAVRERLGIALSRYPGAVFEVDLSDVTFMDALTISLFVDINGRAAQDGGGVRLVGVQPFTRRVLCLASIPSAMLAC